MDYCSELSLGNFKFMVEIINHSCFPQDVFGWILFYNAQGIQTPLTTVFLKLRISYQLAVVNQDIHSVFPLCQGVWIQTVITERTVAFRHSLSAFRLIGWNVKVSLQLSDFMLGYVFFLGLRRRSCSATEPRKYTSWCVPFREVLVMNLSSHCRSLNFR